MDEELRDKIYAEIKSLGDFFMSIYSDVKFVNQRLGIDDVATMSNAEAIAIYHLGGAKALNEAMWVAMSQQLISGETE